MDTAVKTIAIVVAAVCAIAAWQLVARSIAMHAGLGGFYRRRRRFVRQPQAEPRTLKEWAAHDEFLAEELDALGDYFVQRSLRDDPVFPRREVEWQWALGGELKDAAETIRRLQALWVGLRDRRTEDGR